VSKRTFSILSLGPAAREQVAAKLLAEQIAQQKPARDPLPSKWKAKPVIVDGVRFDSQSEYDRWCELKLMERAGQITHLSRQVRFVLKIGERQVVIRSERYPNGRTAVYTADFTYREKNGRFVVEEHKGIDDSVSRLRRAVVEAIYGFEIRMSGPQVLT